MDLIFLPTPRRLAQKDGSFEFAPDLAIQLNATEPLRLLFSGRRLQQRLNDRLNLRWQLAAGFSLPSGAVGIELRLFPGSILPPQGYSLSITSQRILVTASDEAGLFYGVATLCQLVDQAQGNRLPALEIEDWPDFPARGVMLDISRDKVPNMDTLYDLVDRLASWKINQVQLYTEHTFAYRSHPVVWAQASPMTGDEILSLDAFCRERYIELVPNQNSFGHMSRWLRHPAYAPLAEIHGEFKTPWGTSSGPFSLSPVHSGSIALVRSLFDELLPYFSSRMLNVGCDETFDVGAGQSQTACAERGVGRVYLDFLLQIYAEVARRGFTMQFWGDIINDHPELVPELPRDAIGLLWGYEADHPFDQQGARFAAAGVPFYVCPGTSSWNTLAGRTENALANLSNAAENGLKHGACGYLNTDWGDRGHWQTVPISFLGFAGGAAYSWCLESNRGLALPEALDRFAFEDSGGMMGRLAYELGNAYLAGGVRLHNSSLFNLGLAASVDRIQASEKARQANLEAMNQALETAAAGLDGERMRRHDAALIRREFRLAVAMMRHGLRRLELARFEDPTRVTRMKSELGADLAGWLPEYRAIWLERNRPGGLEDSTRWFGQLQEDYGLQ